MVKINKDEEMNEAEYSVMKYMCRLKVPGFPKVYSEGKFQNRPYIVMELLGPSIHDLLQQRKRHFSIKCVMSMGLQILELLEKLHGQGFIQVGQNIVV